MNIDQAIRQRGETIDEDNVMLDKAWRDMIDACVRDVPVAIAFVRNECTVEDMNFLSEVFDELVRQTQSPELTLAIVQASLRYQDFDKRYFLQVLDESVSVFGNHAVQSTYQEARKIASR